MVEVLDAAALERLEAVREAHAARMLELDDAGLCRCDCGSVVPAGGNGRRRYLDDRHKRTANRAQLEAEARALGLDPHAFRLTRETLEASIPTANRPASAQPPPQAPDAPRKRRRPRPGVSVYLPSVELAQVLEVWLGVLAGGKLLRISERAQPDAAAIAEQLEHALERRRRREAADA